MASFGSFLGTALGTDPGAFQRGTEQQIALQNMQRAEQARLNLQKYGGTQPDLGVSLRERPDLDPSGYGSDQIIMPKENTTAADYIKLHKAGVAELNDRRAARVAAEAEAETKRIAAKVGSSNTSGIGYSNTPGITQINEESGTPAEQFAQGKLAKGQFNKLMTRMLFKTKGGYEGQPGSAMLNQLYGKFTDTPERVAARNNAEEATVYFASKEAASYFKNNLDQINAAVDDPIGWYIKNKDRITKEQADALRDRDKLNKAGVITKDQADALRGTGDVLEAKSTNTTNTAKADEDVSSLEVVGSVEGLTELRQEIAANDNNIGDGDVAKKGEVGSPATYIGNPAKAGFDMEQAQKTREEAVRAFNIANRQVSDYQRTAEIYRISGVRDKYVEYKSLAEQAYGNALASRDVVTNLDNSMVYLQGMQGLNDLQFGNNTNRLSQVWSLYSGREVRIVPRDDGLFNITMDGETVSEGMDQRSVGHIAQLQFDSSYKSQIAAAAGKRSEKIFDQQQAFDLEVQKMFNLINVNTVNNNATQELELIKNMGGEIKALSDGTALLQMGTELYLYNPQTEYGIINSNKKEYKPGLTKLSMADAAALLMSRNSFADLSVVKEATGGN